MPDIDIDSGDPVVEIIRQSTPGASLQPMTYQEMEHRASVLTYVDVVQAVAHHVIVDPVQEVARDDEDEAGAEELEI